MKVLYTKLVIMNESKAKPVKLCLNMPAPSGKAKYYQKTDSEPVL